MGENIADTVVSWLTDKDKLEHMSLRAKGLAKPTAARDIARKMCDGLLELGVELKEADSTMRSHVVDDESGIFSADGPTTIECAAACGDPQADVSRTSVASSQSE